MGTSDSLAADETALLQGALELERGDECFVDKGTMIVLIYGASLTASARFGVPTSQLSGIRTFFMY